MTPASLSFFIWLPGLHPSLQDSFTSANAYARPSNTAFDFHCSRQNNVYNDPMQLQFPKNLIDAYQAMSEHTKNECAFGCKVPHSCCSPEYGVMAAKIMRMAKEPIPPDTGSKVCQFMSPTGCVVAPHFRPLCTLHVCCINSTGVKLSDLAWTERYFEIRAEIDALESECMPVWDEFPLT